MTETVGDFIIERLHQWGVKLMFGYPGDGINGTFAALQRVEGRIAYVQVRHEEMAAFMASAYAKFSGEMGVCISTGGPGATHMVTGLYDARLDHQSVLAITGQAAQTVRGAHYQQELNLDRLFADVADYVQEVVAPAQARHVIDQACRVAQANRAPCVVILPADLQLEPMEQPARAHGFVRSGVGYTRPTVVPAASDLMRAADVLNAGERVAMLIGAGAIHAHDEVVAVAETLGAGVAKALLGKAALPDDLPFVTGTIGLLGTEPSSNMMDGCDTLLMVGTSFPWAEFLPADGQARCVQIDIKAQSLGLRYPCEVNLHGDSAATLAALLPLLDRKTERSWRNKIEDDVLGWWQTIESRALAKADPVNPQRVVWEMSPRLPADAIITSDSGSCANWFARDLRIQRGQMASLSGGLASMGAAVPYAIAAKFAHPARPVIALVGDGAMQMNNMAELITVQKYWRQWANPIWICCVFNNEDLNQVTWEQRVMLGEPRFDATQQIPNVPYAKFAESIGLNAIYVDDPEELGSAWDAALAADKPTLIEVKTDPEVPPLPPHINVEQARKFMQTMLKGDSGGTHLLVESMRQVLSSVLPGDKA
ncbi:MAG: thiamine pyrophosphate-requiring protein [Sphingomicrobium sp.]